MGLMVILVLCLTARLALPLVELFQANPAHTVAARPRSHLPKAQWLADARTLAKAVQYLLEPEPSVRTNPPKLAAARPSRLVGIGQNGLSGTAADVSNLIAKLDWTPSANASTSGVEAIIAPELSSPFNGLPPAPGQWGASLDAGIPF